MKPAQMRAVVQRAVYEEVKRIREDIEKICIGAVTAAFMITLHDKWEFDKDELNELLQQTLQQFLAVKAKYVTVDDIREWCKEYGIEGLA